jgi:prepilin-type N-terminal cleavage/methylation domain-containing protein
MLDRRLSRRNIVALAHEMNGRVKSDRGFTLIELLIVIVVLGVLAAVVIFALGGVNAQAAVSACRSDAKSVQRAVTGFEDESGSDPASLDALTQGPNPYLQSLPTSAHFTFSLQDGIVMVAAPPTATPVDATTPGACTGAGQEALGSAPTTVPATTPTNGVTATGTYTIKGKKVTEIVSLSNASAMSALTITIDVTSSTGETLTLPKTNETISYPKKDFSDSTSTSGGDVSYTYLLTTGTIAGGSGTATAIFDSSTSSHSFSGDTWSITSVSNGISATTSGVFGAS